MTFKRKLIEVALPLEDINREASREKSIRHGHPSTLHLWWARRPLAAARAVIWASLVDDPSSHPDQFPTEKDQANERERLFDILRKLIVWENSNDEEILNAAKEEIMKSTDNNPPALLDPFAGGGAIPLEAQRLGLEAHAHDLNPVAVLINKAMIEIPAKFANLPPINPQASTLRIGELSVTKQKYLGLADDVCYYGEMLKNEAFSLIGHFYPKVDLSSNGESKETNVIAWIWARTVKCPNPACGREMPLARSYALCKKKGKEVYVEPVYVGNELSFNIHYNSCDLEHKTNKVGRNAVFQCPLCGEITTDAYIKQQGKNNSLSQKLMAIVAEGSNGRVYLPPTFEHERIANVDVPSNIPRGSMPRNPRWFTPPFFGKEDYSSLFTNRQLLSLTTFSNLIKKIHDAIFNDALRFFEEHPDILKNISFFSIDHKGIAEEYSRSICLYLALLIDKLADRSSSICAWDIARDSMSHTFGRQAIPMTWDFAEANPFSNSSGSFSNSLSWIYKVINNLPLTTKIGYVKQEDAQFDSGLRNLIVSTDPPYYDNIGYSDLSDFFYIWLRRSLQDYYPEIFQTLLTPKKEELVAIPYRFSGNAQEARLFFESGMLNTCLQLFKYSRVDVPVTIYYAYKSNESGGTREREGYSSSVGWETMLSAIVKAGFAVVGTWPMRTELANRTIAIGTNGLASSIVLVCRKREHNADICTRKYFINALKIELRPAIEKMLNGNIAPVDLAQSAIGPGMAVYSRYSQVLESDGTPLTVRDALGIINKELDSYFNEQSDNLDKNSRFCVDWYMLNSYDEKKSGEADLLANAKGTSLASLVKTGVFEAKGGIARLKKREELDLDLAYNEPTTWKLCQQLVRAVVEGGVQKCAELAINVDDGRIEDARSLAYRLHNLAERNKWTQEAYAYNALISLWPDIQTAISEIQSKEKAQFLFDISGD